MGLRQAVSLGALAELPLTPPGQLIGDPATEISGMTHDSRLAERGMLFACVRGGHVDGHTHAAAAVDNGAVALLVDHRMALDVDQLVVADTREAMGAVAAAVYGQPSAALRVVGVTGTNGKTTTTQLLAAVFRAAGRSTGVIGTLSGAHTTPEAPELQARLASFRDDDVAAVVMEVSSHALALHRVDGTRFAAAVFTNLGRDHLDLHGTVEEYFRAKARLFAPGFADLGVTNVDDAHGRLLFDAAPIEMVPYSLADAHDIDVSADHHAFTWRGRRLRVGLGGPFNVSNSLAAATTAAALDLGLDEIEAGLAAADPVPGRFERVTADASGAPTVLVDYAHTPDGLEGVIDAARHIGAGRVIVVFGCGGDRDHAKRPMMGAVAGHLADRVVVTSDNPRSEDPAAIVDEVVAGVSAADRSKVDVEVDRGAAIAQGIALAGPGDVVVIAGKGHETTQAIGDRVIAFDDRAVARRVLGEQRP